jgi:hypothetical protein
MQLLEFPLDRARPCATHAMWSVGYVTLFVGSCLLPLWHEHWKRHKVVNLPQIALALFGCINVLICLWEISLFFHIKLIKSQFAAMKRKLPAGTMPQPMFLFENVPLLQVRTAVKESLRTQQEAVGKASCAVCRQSHCVTGQRCGAPTP